mmetsp:Transcript_48332/g.117057  ORF Transcript_48332/g.117057 Transcript_48332/m.117057 type:complete len:160 (-) Transcript_48332:105-584(-)
MNEFSTSTMTMRPFHSLFSMIYLMLTALVTLVPRSMSFAPSSSRSLHQSYHHPAFRNSNIYNGQILFAATDDDEDKTTAGAVDVNVDVDDVQPKAEYGVSYIGGDPCGSKLNDDPFDTQVQKPGMPDDMKNRIQALVEKKVAEEKAAAAAAATEAGDLQ